MLITDVLCVSEQQIKSSPPTTAVAMTTPPVEYKPVGFASCPSSFDHLTDHLLVAQPAGSAKGQENESEASKCLGAVITPFLAYDALVEMNKDSLAIEMKLSEANVFAKKVEQVEERSVGSSGRQEKKDKVTVELRDAEEAESSAYEDSFFNKKAKKDQADELVKSPQLVRQVDVSAQI